MPAVSSISGCVRCERCCRTLPRHDETFNGQTDRTLCTPCFRSNPISARLTIRIPPSRPRATIHISERRPCPSCLELRPSSSFSENRTICHTCETCKRCKTCTSFFPFKKFWDTNAQPTHDECYRCRTTQVCKRCPGRKRHKLKNYIPISLMKAHPGRFWTTDELLVLKGQRKLTGHCLKCRGKECSRKEQLRQEAKELGECSLVCRITDTNL
jgi:hypothetical protein